MRTDSEKLETALLMAQNRGKKSAKINGEINVLPLTKHCEFTRIEVD